MPKKLYLIRHSYAEPISGGLDFDRKLTHKGQNTIRSLGKNLTEKKVDLSLILCSPVRRAKETAINLVEELNSHEQIIKYENIIYNASIRELLSIVNKIPNKYTSVALIGHNPAITFLGEYITGTTIGNMNPASVVIIEIKKLKWTQITKGVGIFEEYYHSNHFPNV